jgi:hypothetical protein
VEKNSTLLAARFAIISHQECSDFHYSYLVSNFINSFSIGLTLLGERYKIPAEQQALTLPASLL